MFNYTTVLNYHSALKNGQTTCVEAVLHYIQAIENHKNLNAWLEIYGDEALERAAILDNERSEGKPLGKLHGVVIGLKDVICYKGHKVSAASKILENFTSLYSATATERLLQEGAIIIGRQNCDEFAMGSSNENSAYGSVKNAIDSQRVPGGSSGGSAVSVQAGMCMLSLGSDTGGSVRQPADFCGIIGLKPSYGRISRHGLIAYASSFDQIGIFGTDINDVFAVLEVIEGPDEYDSTLSVKEKFKPAIENKQVFKIAYFENALNHPRLDPEIATNIKAFIEKLTALGHVVEPIDFKWLEYIIPTYYVLTTAEASSNLSRYDGVKFGYRNETPEGDLTALYKSTRSKGFGKEVKRRILLGTFVLSEGYFDAYFTKAQRVRKLLTQETKTIFDNYDAIILPTVPNPAFRLGEKTKDPIEMFLADLYTVYANLVGIPAISLPLFKNDKGMPFGLQVMTSQHNELLLHGISKMMLES